MSMKAWAIGVFGVVAAGLVLGVWNWRLSGHSYRSEFSVPQVPLPSPSQARPQVARPLVFQNYAGSAGIDFTYDNGARGLWYLVETFGGGVGLLDYDGDGWLDIYLIQGGSFPPVETNPSRNRLYRNTGNGTFTDVTDEARVGDNGYGQGVAVGDYDNDGDPDLYVANYGPDVLYRNNGDGTFTDVTADAGLGCELSGLGCAFGDMDGDGDLDLYVANYADLDLAHHEICRERELNLPVHCPPTRFRPLPDFLYRNNGDGTFTDVTTEAGIHDENEGRGMGVLIADINQDGRLDIYVANDQARNFLFLATGPLSFEERGRETGSALGSAGDAQGSMGVAYGDSDGDARPDLFVTNYYNETNMLYRSMDGGFFTDDSRRSNLAPLSRAMVAWGTQFVDFDQDGWLDLFITNGHINETQEQLRAEYAMHPQVLWNQGKGWFVDVSSQAGSYFAQRWVGRGAAFGDIDNDGDVDIAVTHLHEPFALLRNETPEPGRYLVLRLIGDPGLEGGSSRDPVGAKVIATWGDRKWVREVIGGGSYLSASDSRVFLGVGEVERLDRLEVVWPSGRRQAWEGMEVSRPGRALLVVEGREPQSLSEYYP